MTFPEAWPPGLTFRGLLALNVKEIERLDERALASLDDFRLTWGSAQEDPGPTAFEDSPAFARLTWPFLTSAATTLRRLADETIGRPDTNLRISRAIDPVSDEGKALWDTFDRSQFSLELVLLDRGEGVGPMNAVTAAFETRREQWSPDVALLMAKAIGIWVHVLANIDRGFDSRFSLVNQLMPDRYNVQAKYLGIGWNREMLAHMASLAGLHELGGKLVADLPLGSARDRILSAEEPGDADVVQLGRRWLEVPENEFIGCIFRAPRIGGHPR